MLTSLRDEFGRNRAQLPAPLALALDRLRTAVAHAWIVDTQVTGAPFSVAPLQGWAKETGEGMVVATVEQKPIQAAILGKRRLIRLDTHWDWKRPLEVIPQNPAQAIEIARVLSIQIPTVELSTLLGHIAAVRMEGDGTFVVVLDVEGTTKLVSSLAKDLSNRGFPLEITGAFASIRLWLTAGTIQRYIVSCTVRSPSPEGTKEINWVTAVELNEISAARATLPSTAFSKLLAAIDEP